MKCHRLLQSTFKATECYQEECSLWNSDKQECSEKTYFASWGAIYALQAKMQYLLEKMNEDVDEE